MAYGDAMAGTGRIARRRTTMGQPGQSPMDWNDRGSMAGAEGAAYGDASGAGSAANANYYGRLQSFDPSASVNQFAQGAWGSISEGLKHTLADQSGAAVGAGRFDTGFLDQDKGTVINTATNQLANAVAQQSLAATGMQQRNTEAIGQYGAQQQARGDDFMTARREELENNYREEEERKRKRRAGIGGAIGGVLGATGGFLLGGPAGAAAGWQGGSAVGSAF